MLPAKNRLTRKDDFQLVYKDGKFFSVRDFSLICKENSFPQTRIGIIVSKKNFKKATDRNRIKRLMREVLQEKLAFIKPGMDVVIHSKLQKIPDLKEITASLVGLLKKSKLLN